MSRAGKLAGIPPTNQCAGWPEVSIRMQVPPLGSRGSRVRVADEQMSRFFAAEKGVLDHTACSVLSKLIFNLFQPTLLMVNVASTLASSSQSLGTLGMLPVFALLQIFAGALVGAIIVRVLRLSPKSQSGRELRMSCSFGNAGPLPLLFADALFAGKGDPTLGPRVVALISFYLLGWSPSFWTFGRSILSSEEKVAEADKEAGGLKALLASPTAQRILSPPVMASVVGVVVGMNPFLKKIFLSPGAVARPFTEGLRTIGSAYVPAVILTLAGTLQQSVRASRSPGGPSATKQKDVSVATKVTALMIARFIIMPIFGFFLTTNFTRLGLIPRDPLLHFVLLMQSCMPSAQNSVVILQLDNNDKAAGSMAKTLSLLYIAACVPIAILLSGASMVAGI